MTRVGDVTLLGNPALPILEVNAAYSAARLEGYPVVICPSALEHSGLEGFGVAGVLVALEAVGITSSIWVEQVAWTQADQLAKVWCEQNDASDWLALTARELARSLELHPDLLAYLAYQGDDVIGMMIASSDGFSGWWAGADHVAGALFARGVSDFGRLVVSAPLERRGAFKASSETARFDIWLRTHQPSDGQTKPLPDP